MNQLLNIIANNDKCSYKWLEGTAGFQMGLSARTFKTYIEQLTAIRKIITIDGNIKVTDS